MTSLIAGCLRGGLGLRDQKTLRPPRKIPRMMSTAPARTLPRNKDTTPQMIRMIPMIHRSGTAAPCVTAANVRSIPGILSSLQVRAGIVTGHYPTAGESKLCAVPARKTAHGATVSICEHEPLKPDLSGDAGERLCRSEAVREGGVEPPRPFGHR